MNDKSRMNREIHVRFRESIGVKVQRTTVIMTDADDQIHHIKVSGMAEPEHTNICQLLKVKDTLKREHELVWFASSQDESWAKQ